MQDDYALYAPRYEDQQKVRRAIAVLHVDFADVPESAKVAPPPVIMPVASASTFSTNAVAGGKRKYYSDVGLSQPYVNGAQGSSALLEDEYDDPVEAEVADELYCVLRTSIVGVQYYKGMYLARTNGSCCAYSTLRPCWGRRTGQTGPTAQQSI